MRNVYWLAIDTDHTSYEELVERRTIAQGWRGLGNLITLNMLVPQNNVLFMKVIQAIGDKAYHGAEWWSNTDRKKRNTPKIMWELLNLKKGDLVVGIEGTSVRGVCEVKENGNVSYIHDNNYEYAQMVGGNIQWVDWCKYRLGKPPTPPAQSVKGMKNLVSEKDAVIKSWGNINENDPWWSKEAIENTLRMDVLPRDNKIYFKHIKDKPSFRYISWDDHLNNKIILKNHDNPSDSIEFDSTNTLVQAGWVLD